MNKATKKQIILSYFRKHKKVTVLKASNDLKISKKNLLDWLWCLDNRDCVLSRFVFNGEIKILSMAA